MRYTVDTKTNMYFPSDTYGQAFGFEVRDTVKNCKVKSYLLHQWANLLAEYPLSKKDKAYVKRIASKYGYEVSA